MASAITQKTITTRTLPIDPDPQARSTPDFWEYIEKLKPEEWSRHIVYIYRTDPRASNYGDGQSNIDKCPGYIEMRDGSQVPFNDREEVERAIQEKHGGKAFRLIVKRGHERVTEGKCCNDAPPKYMHQSFPSNGNGNSTGVSVTPMTEASSTADVAKQAITTMAGQDRQATEVAISALRGAAEVVQRLATPPNSPGNSVMEQFMSAMLQRMMNPPDPMEQITKILALVNTLRPQGAVDPNLPPNSPLNKVMELAIERLIHPESTVPPVNASAELVRQLPMVAGRVTEAIREWRLGSEAQLATANIMSQQGRPAAPPAQPSNVLPVATGTQPRQVPPANPSQSSPSTQENIVSAPTIEFVETKIIEILKEDISAEDAADDCFEFLARIDPTTVSQLASLGEAGLMQLFNARPILRQATSNVPRLTEFIKAFLKFANEDLMNPAPTMPPGNA